MSRSRQIKKTIVESPEKDDQRDELGPTESSKSSKKRKLQLSRRDVLGDSEGNSMVVVERHQRGDKEASSSEDEGNIARQNLLQARAGVAFMSPSASLRRSLLTEPVRAGRDTSSSREREKQTESTGDPQGSEDGEVVERTAKRTRDTSKKRKTHNTAAERARAVPLGQEAGANAPAAESRATPNSPGDQQEVPTSAEEGEDANTSQGEVEGVDEEVSADDTVTLLKRYGRDGEDPSSSESDDSADSNNKPRRPHGAFKLTPQEIYDGLRGDEDPVEKGWNRKFLTTIVNTEMGKLSFVAALGIKRKVYQRVLAQVRKDRKGENSYVPHLHITQNQGFKANMVADLSWTAFKKLQTEWGIAQALTPGQIDHTGLIPASLHRELRIQLGAYCDTHLPDQRRWLKSFEDNSWMDWSASLFFDRVLRVYPIPT